MAQGEPDDDEKQQEDPSKDGEDFMSFFGINIFSLYFGAGSNTAGADDGTGDGDKVIMLLLFTISISY